MKTNAIIRIVLFSLAILVLLSVLLGVLAFKSYRFDIKLRQDHIEAVTEQFELEYITPDIRNIEIDWVAGSITIQKDPYATEITVHEIAPTGCEYIMVCKQSGQTLKIQYCDDAVSVFQFPSFGVNIDISKDLVITVPENWECDTLEIDTAAAEVIVNDLTVKELDFDGASGECKITNCDVGEMDIDTASGDVYFSGTLETLDCDAASANCTIEATNIPRSIKMDVMSGDLELILPPDAGFTCELDSMSSSFDTDFEFKMRDGQHICGDGSCKIKISGLSGAVSILKGIE